MSVMCGSVLAEHLLISLVPWLAVVAVGGGLGYVCALVARSLFCALPGLRRPSILLPWRTVVVTLLLLSPIVPLVVGLGRAAGVAIVGLFVFLLAVPLTTVTLLEHWCPSPLLVRLIAGARTLATGAVAVAAVTTVVGAGGGAGWLIFEGMKLLEYREMFLGFSIVVLLALMSDILLGAFELLLSLASRKAQPVHSVVA